MDFSNVTSEQLCWFGDENVPLPDLKTEDAEVISGFQGWIKNMVQEYGIDGLRIDGSWALLSSFHPTNPDA
jgi:alpha-amylase